MSFAIIYRKRYDRETFVDDICSLRDGIFVCWLWALPDNQIIIIYDN